MTEFWIDCQGDPWVLGDDGLMHSPETAPFSREHVEKKWGPLTLAAICVHCGQPIKGHTHLAGLYRGKSRCCPEDSGLQYGYNAHVRGTPCLSPCLGEIYPDPKLADGWL